MAGQWIKMRNNLWDDPRVSRICDLTDQPEAAIVGGLYWLWAAADEHTEDGYLPGLTTAGINRKTGVKGLGEALVQIGWLEDNGDSVTIVNFSEHNGASAKRRCSEAKRKGSVRKVSASDADKLRTRCGQNADDARKDRGQDAELEKEREEDKKKDKDTRAPRGAVCEIPADFEAAWAAYPKRSGGNSKKAALKAWQARVNAGADPAELLAGASRYAQHVRAEGKEGTRFVMQAATFFGPDEHYAEPWAEDSEPGFDWEGVI